MARKSSSKWADTHREVSQAQELLQAMAAVNPVRYQPLSDNEEETWDKLLRDID
jgi:hypothetical protein